ncbi:MAG: T9SS type A sorting domain-containing protein, partial [Candidatus Latescibacteria bacterium]|nr:T9SS type A sorting domain-containing protein [Candidatus Latescibacterota bacterium]
MTEESGQNIKPGLAVDSEGRIWLAWQSNCGGSWTAGKADWGVYTKFYDGNVWSAEALAVDYHGTNDLLFDIAADGEGKVWTGWNSAKFDGDSETVMIGGSYYWKGEWNSVSTDTINEPYERYPGPVGLFFHKDSLCMVIVPNSLETYPRIYDFYTHTFETLNNYPGVYPRGICSPISFLSQIGDEKVWVVLNIISHFAGSPETYLLPTAYFLSNESWDVRWIDLGIYSPHLGGLVRYVSVKSVGSDARSKIYITCTVDDEPVTRDVNGLAYYLNTHLEVWSFNATTGDTLSHWNLGDTEPSVTCYFTDDGIEVSTTDESEIVGFAISRNGDTSLRALRDSIWYKPVSLEEDSTITSAYPSAVVDHLGNIWVAWDDGKDIYVSWVNIADMEVDELLTSVKSDAEDIAAKPARFFLAPNYPNPFNVSTSIVFQIPFDTVAELSVYDLLGQRVRALISG